MVVGVLSPPLDAAKLSEADYPLQSSRSFASKSRIHAEASVPLVCGLGVIPPSPSPPAFQSDIASSQYRSEIPDSFNGVGVSSRRLDSTPPHTDKADCVNCEFGLPGPAPPLDDSIPDVLGSPVNGAAVDGAMPQPRSRSPLPEPVLPPIGRPRVHLDSSDLPISSTAILGQSSVIAPLGKDRPPIAKVLDRSCPQTGAPDSHRGSPASARPLGADDRPPRKLWSNVVKQNSPGGMWVNGSEIVPEGMLGYVLGGTGGTVGML